MRTTFRLASALLVPLLLINACFYAVAPVTAHAGEEMITRFEPESAESEPNPEPEQKKQLSLLPWILSAAVIGFIAVGISGTKSDTDSGSGGAIDVGW